MSPALLAAFRMLGECEGVAGSNLEGTRDGEIRLLSAPSSWCRRGLCTGPLRARRLRVCDLMLEIPDTLRVLF